METSAENRLHNYLAAVRTRFGSAHAAQAYILQSVANAEPEALRGPLQVTGLQSPLRSYAHGTLQRQYIHGKGKVGGASANSDVFRRMGPHADEAMMPP